MVVPYIQAASCCFSILVKRCGCVQFIYACFTLCIRCKKATSAQLGEAGCSTALRCPTSNQSCSTRQLHPSLTVSSVGRHCLRTIFLYERKVHDNDIKIKLDTVVLSVILEFLAVFPDDINVWVPVGSKKKVGSPSPRSWSFQHFTVLICMTTPRYLARGRVVRRGDRNGASERVMTLSGQKKWPRL